MYNIPPRFHKTDSNFDKNHTLHTVDSQITSDGIAAEAVLLLTATHSVTSTYLGSMAMVLKFPFTRAASTKGLHRYKGFCPLGVAGGNGGGKPGPSNGAEVGVVGERRGLRV